MSDFIQVVLILGLIALVVFLFWFFVFKVKHLKTPDVFMVDGGVKTGKTLVTVMLAVKQYRKNLIRYYLRLPIVKLVNFIRKRQMSKGKNTHLIVVEKPMLYSNMPLYKVKYNPLTLDILCLKYRIPHKSVVILDEASLIADSLTAFGKSKLAQEEIDFINEKLTIFLKVGISHGAHGSSCFYNSQNVVDLHFAFRRCTSTYLMITKNKKYPFFCLLDVREIVHDESNDVVNTYTRDVDDENKPLFVSKRWYKYYDRYYLDVLFKHLPLMVDYTVKPVSPRVKTELSQVLTLGKFKFLKEYNEGSKQ